MGIVPGKFPGIGSEDLFARIPKNFHKFVSGFSEELENKKFPGISYKKFLGSSYENFLGMGYKKFLGPGSSEKLSTFSPDFPVKDNFRGFSAKFVLGLHIYIHISILYTIDYPGSSRPSSILTLNSCSICQHFLFDKIIIKNLRILQLSFVGF